MSTSDGAALSSMVTALEDLTERVVSLADRYEGSDREDVLADLHEAERSLRLASRRLTRAAASLTRS
ncbi:MAG: hypothetical protein IPM45_17215 [Acidimicrobiales bacterium]|nr:hypothetical protein [Acidimicrobiales bacterium]